MYFFFSGEGPTDLGEYNDKPGPLAMIADQIILNHYHYSFIESECAVFVLPADLERIKPKLRTPRRSPALRGLKTPPENRLHRKDAAALVHAASSHIQDKESKEFVAVLFRDSGSPDKKEWNDKRNSMIHGFNDGLDDLKKAVKDGNIEGKGVAAVARPVSEAWWLSAIYRREYANKDKDCKYLESTGYGKRDKHALKIELEEKLGTETNRTVLNDMVENRKIDYDLIDSESFLAFKKDFETAVGLGYLHGAKTTP